MSGSGDGPAGAIPPAPPLVAALVTLGDPGRLTGGYLYHQQLAARAARHGFRLAFVSIPDRRFPLPLLAGRWALAEVRRLGAQALVLDSIAAAFLGPWLALHPSGLPVLGMLHQPPGGIDHGVVRTRLQAGLDRLAYRGVCRLLVASQPLAARIIAEGTPRSLVEVIPPGRDPCAVPAGPPSDPRRGRQAALLCVGNWLPRKGIHHLLDALARLPPELATLHLVGDDRVDPAYTQRIRARLGAPDLAGRVVVHGWLPVAKVAALYAAADVFVLPSTVEPYGTVYGEAMTAGLPVVGWRAGNLPYLVDDGREGYLLPAGDIVGLARVLARVASDEPHRRNLGEAAASRALTWPTWDQTAGRFFAAVRLAIAEARGAATAARTGSADSP